MIDELRKLPWRPGSVDVLIDTHDRMGSEWGKRTAIASIEKAIQKYVEHFENGLSKVRGLGAPTSNERQFYKWAKGAHHE